MQRRYRSGTAVRRGQHAKPHACVTGTLTVRKDLPAVLRHGIFLNPGHRYDTWVRYSNAAAAAGPDSMQGADGAPPVHGSRGMAVKVLGVQGVSLTPARAALEQDFLLVNHPVFPFANVEEYEAVTRAVTADKAEKPDRFFAERIRRRPDGSPDLTDPMTLRALRALRILKRIQSSSPTAEPPAFQDAPACPIDVSYFAAAPFLFGPDHVMRVRVTPAHPATTAAPDVADDNYLRTALTLRLAGAGASEARFEFQAQVRSAADVADAIDTDIEDASEQWDEARWPFVTLAILTIPPQAVDGPEREAWCEALSFSPWHGIEDHRPLGGINRLRRAVYEASVALRLPRPAAQS
jgi:hypothetical protein